MLYACVEEADLISRNRKKKFKGIAGVDTNVSKDISKPEELFFEEKTFERKDISAMIWIQFNSYTLIVRHPNSKITQGKLAQAFGYLEGLATDIRQV